MSGVKAAYDHLAPAYDELFVARGRIPWQRAYSPHLRPGVRVLDAGCGTGADLQVALRKGCVGTGLDGSEGMLAVAADSLRRERLDAVLRCGDLSEVGELFEADAFDVILSGFAAINTVDRMDKFAAGCAKTLRRGGVLALHFLTPCGAFDRVGHLVRGDLRAAALHWRGGTRVVRVGSQGVHHRFFLPRDLFHAEFAAAFTCIELAQVGLLTPDDGPTRVPHSLLGPLARMEERLRRAPMLSSLGRFAILVLRRS